MENTKFGPGVYSETGFTPVPPPTGPVYEENIADIFRDAHAENTKSVLQKIFRPVCMGFAGFGGMMLGKSAMKRPVFSGIHHHLLATTVMTYLGYKWQKYLDRCNMERDAILHHYITLHPEDFPHPGLYT